ncbi:MAG: hypothetical protein NT074_00070 [Methanomicrobiales archaeon]|nr:hypothetical protein [Methanomicrobiales archaeon]
MRGSTVDANSVVRLATYFSFDEDDERTYYYCEGYVDEYGNGAYGTSLIGNSPRNGVCGCHYDDKDAIPWHPDKVTRRHEVRSG